MKLSKETLSRLKKTSEECRQSMIQLGRTMKSAAEKVIKAAEEFKKIKKGTKN